MEEAKSTNWLWIGIIILSFLIVVGGLLYYSTIYNNYYLQSIENNSAQTSISSGQSSTTIKNGRDLQNASKQLDNTDIDGAIDPGLNQNDSDASQF